MKNDSMLRRLQAEPATSSANTGNIRWYDQEITIHVGDTVASALLMAGIRASRKSAVSGSARLPFCMMGSCFECLVDVDGQIVQSCMVPAENGMTVKMPEVQTPLEQL